jgi:hypothetical protein
MSAEQLGLPGITQTYACRITFSENNSGGCWWLKQEQYANLFKVWWKPGRECYDGTVRGASRIIVLDAIDEDVALAAASKLAIMEWEKATGENADEIGCTCCGPPYQFYDWDSPILLTQERSAYEMEDLHAMFEEDD